MTYVKSLLVGIGGAVLASFLWILATFILPIVVPYMIRRMDTTAGVGADYAYVDSGSVMIAALVGFIAAFAWHRRKSRRH